MIEIKDICFSYKTSQLVFCNFSWCVNSGDTWSVIGPSGCGKTTLLYLLAGLYLPTSGEIQVNGSALLKPRLSTGLILQDYGLLPWANAFDNVSLGLKIRRLDRQKMRETTSEWLTRLGIDAFADRYPVELSGGQRQRVAIARTLALEPDILLMDEPFGSLDALTREDMQNLTISLWEKVTSTIILVTHNIEEAVLLGKKILVLNHPPNKRAVIMNNPGSGYPEYRNSPEFVEKCQELRGLVEHSAVRNGIAEIPGTEI